MTRWSSEPARWIEVFNRGRRAFRFRVRPAAPWLRASRVRGVVDDQVRVRLRVDWRRAPVGVTRVPIVVSGPGGQSVTVRAVVEKPARRGRGFLEAGGYVAMEAAHFSRAVGRWERLADIGRTGDGMEPVPVTAPSVQPGGGSPRLEYRMTLRTTGPVKVTAFLSPRNPVLSPDGLRYAISVDGAPPQVVNITKATGADDTFLNRQWERNTSDNVNRTTTTHVIRRRGTHVLKFWKVDPTVVLQRLEVDTGGVRDSYLGPPESRRVR
jgi:hypothetical protein